MKIVHKKNAIGSKELKGDGMKNLMQTLQDSLKDVDEKIEKYLNRKPSNNENFKTRIRNSRST